MVGHVVRKGSRRYSAAMLAAFCGTSSRFLKNSSLACATFFCQANTCRIMKERTTVGVFGALDGEGMGELDSQVTASQSAYWRLPLTDFHPSIQSS